MFVCDVPSGASGPAYIVLKMFSKTLSNKWPKGQKFYWLLFRLGGTHKNISNFSTRSKQKKCGRQFDL